MKQEDYSERTLFTKQDLKTGIISAGAIMALAIMIVTQLLNKESLDTPLTIALICFAVLIPLEAAGYIGGLYEMRAKYMARTLTRWEIYASWFTSAILVAGLIACFWHFSWIIGGIFLASCLVAVIYLAFYLDMLEKLNKEAVQVEKVNQ